MAYMIQIDTYIFKVLVVQLRVAIAYENQNIQQINDNGRGLLNNICNNNSNELYYCP